MKVPQFGLMFDHDNAPSFSLVCKRLRPLAPKLTGDGGGAITISPPAFDLKSFIKPESSSPTRLGSSPESKKDSPHQAAVETHPGGTRWNPTQEQIGILEMLYRGGMRTPNAQQIEQITAQLGMYGKIEGKNVFYWFQNHKARERQKQKRNTLGGPTTPPPTLSLDPIMAVVGSEEESGKKRRCRSWAVEFLELEEKKSSCCRREEGDRTLELFPLHPELGR